MHTGGLPTPPPPCPNRQLQTAVPQLPARNRNVTLPAKRDRLRPGSRQLPIGNQRFTDFDKRSCRPGTPSINRMQVNGRVLTRRKLTGSGVTGCRDGATWQLQGCQAVRLSGRWLSGRWLSGCQAVRLSGCWLSGARGFAAPIGRGRLGCRLALNSRGETVKSTLQFRVDLFGSARLALWLGSRAK